MSSASRKSAAHPLRELLGVALIPALVVGSTYVLLVRPRAARSHAEAQVRLDSMRREATQSVDDQLEVRLRAELAQLQERKEQVFRGRAAIAERFLDGAALARTLAEHKLTLLEERALGASRDIDAEVQARRWLEAQGLGGRASTRTVRVQGAYFDVLAALRALLDAELGALLLHIEMQTSPNLEELPTWTLILA